MLLISSSSASHVSRRTASHRIVRGHFREESQTPDGEAMRDDDEFAYVARGIRGRVGRARVESRASHLRERETLAEEYKYESPTARMAAAGPSAKGSMVEYDAPEISPDMSF